MNLTSIKNLILLSLFYFIFIGCSSPEIADLVIKNGIIYTVNDLTPVVETVAVEDGKISAFGTNETISKRIGSTTRVLDLDGKTMTPGFIEGHGHFVGLGYAKLNLNLQSTRNYQELLQRVAAAVAKSKPGEWITGRGWHQSKWQPQPEKIVKGFQTHELLSKISPDNPVYLSHASGHAGFANARAMEIAGITRNSKFSGDGEIIKDSSGNPTGIFTENAENLITRHIPETTEEKDKRAVKLAVEECLKNGITTFCDAGANEKQIDLYKANIAEGNQKIRLWVMLDGSDDILPEEYYTTGPLIGYGNNYLTIRAIKLYADGALGSRGAWLQEPYSDRPGHSGHATMFMEKIFQVSYDALNHGFQTCVHAIGDRANREVLDLFEKTFKLLPEKASDHRFRIEHAQHISLPDIPRFAELGVIPAMQGIHMSSDRPWAIERLGEKRILEGAYAWQKLLKSGAIIANGTDTPVEPIDPIACFYASVTRKTLDGFPPGGFEPDQKMTRMQALKSYTLHAAYAAFEDNIKGSIEVGKLADFTVFSQNIMEIPENKILETRVDYTIINGKIEFKRN